MKLDEKSNGKLDGLLLALFCLGLASCETVRSESSELQIKIADGKFRMSANNGRCAKLTYYDAGRQPIGCEVYELPVDGICPPPGTAGASGAIVACPPGRNRIDSSRMGAQQPNSIDALSHLDTYRFFGLPYDLQSGDVYLEYDLEIRARSADQAHWIRDHILCQARLGLAGFQEPVPGIYQVHHLAQAQLVGSQLLITLMDTASYEQLDVSINDLSDYAGIDDAHLISRNGWHLAGITVALDDLHWGLLPGTHYENTYAVDLKNRGTEPRTLSGTWGYTP